MARTVVPVNRLSHVTLVTGPSETTGDTVNGHVIANDGSTSLDLRNSGSSSPTVTVSCPAGYDTNLTAGPRVYTLSPNKTSYTGTFPVSLYGPTLVVDVSSTAVRILAFSMASA